ERHVPRGVTAELVSEVDEEARIESVTPVDRGRVGQLAAGCQKSEEIGIVGARTLQLQRAGEIVLPAQLAVHAELHAVLMEAADDGRLKVVAGVPIEVRQWIKAEQGLRLRADAAARDLIAREREARRGIDHQHGLT